MKIYMVGGAVRDKLLGIEPSDIDYVVVDSSPDEMLSLGYKQVGADFPVFLHPTTGEEYALARTERKVGHGYSAFACNYKHVTLKEDLERRDFTINSIAYDMEKDEYIDPFNGIKDLEYGLLKPTSIAFKEDPVRVLRAARFAAKYNFHFSNELLDMIVDMKSMGELDFLQPERVMQEFKKSFDSNCFKDFVVNLNILLVIEHIWNGFNFEYVKLLNDSNFNVAIVAMMTEWNDNFNELCKKHCIPTSASKLSKQYHIIKNTDFDDVDSVHDCLKFIRADKNNNLYELMKFFDAAFVKRFYELRNAYASVDVKSIVENSPTIEISDRIKEARLEKLMEIC